VASINIRTAPDAEATKVDVQPQARQNRIHRGDTMTGTIAAISQACFRLMFIVDRRSISATEFITFLFSKFQLTVSASNRVEFALAAKKAEQVPSTDHKKNGPRPDKAGRG
jgi:hypothetical protein